MYISYKQTDWDQHLTAAEFAINNTKQASTGISPFYLNYGFHLHTPASMWTNEQITVQSVTEFTTQMKDLLQKAQQAMLQAQQRQAKYANQHRSEESFDIGEKVLLSNCNKTIIGQNQEDHR